MPSLSAVINVKTKYLIKKEKKKKTSTKFETIFFNLLSFSSLNHFTSTSSTFSSASSQFEKLKRHYDEYN